MNKDRGENLLKYKGPTSLKGVEERLLEIEYEKPMRIHNIEENFPRGNDIGYEIEIDSIAYLETDGDLYLGDTDLTNNTTVTNPFTVDTWHYVEFYWSNTNGGTLLFFVDGVQKGSLVGNFSGTIERWRIINNNASNPSLIINIDDVYIADGATSTTELLGSNFCVSKVYQGDGLTTEGSALNAGSWANTQEFPGNDTNTASYTGTPLSGGTTLTGGSRQGPNGDAALSGTRKCVLGVFRAKRGSGGGTTHKLRLGNNTDGMTDFTIAITTSFVNWWVLSESESVAATFTEYGKMGMSVSGAQDIVMADMYYMLGYVKAAASSDGNFFFAFQ